MAQACGVRAGMAWGERAIVWSDPETRVREHTVHGYVMEEGDLRAAVQLDVRIRIPIYDVPSLSQTVLRRSPDRTRRSAIASRKL